MLKKTCPHCGGQYSVTPCLVGGPEGGFVGIRVRCKKCGVNFEVHLATWLVLAAWILSLIPLTWLLLGETPLGGIPSVVLYLILSFSLPFFYILLYMYLLDEEKLNERVADEAKRIASLKYWEEVKKSEQ